MDKIDRDNLESTITLGLLYKDIVKMLALENGVRVSIWCLDSYDKLRRYGICINGCVDGFARKVMWMNAYHSASDPMLIGGYYLEVVESLGGCPMLVRGDACTENAHVCDIQRFLRMDHDDSMAGDISFIEGAGTANQRIEYR